MKRKKLKLQKQNLITTKNKTKLIREIKKRKADLCGSINSRGKRKSARNRKI